MQPSAVARIVAVSIIIVIGAAIEGDVRDEAVEAMAMMTAMPAMPAVPTMSTREGKGTAGEAMTSMEWMTSMEGMSSGEVTPNAAMEGRKPPNVSLSRLCLRQGTCGR